MGPGGGDGSVCAPVAAAALAVLLLTSGAGARQDDRASAAVASGYGWIGSPDEMAGGRSEVEFPVDGGSWVGTTG